MKALMFAAVAAYALAGCATAEQVYAPSGNTGYAVDCSGEVSTWADCYQKAGEVCAPRGYTVLDGGAEQQASMGSGGFGNGQWSAYGGTYTNRTMLIECK